MCPGSASAATRSRACRGEPPGEPGIQPCTDATPCAAQASGQLGGCAVFADQAFCRQPPASTCHQGGSESVATSTSITSSMAKTLSTRLASRIAGKSESGLKFGVQSGSSSVPPIPFPDRQSRQPIERPCADVGAASASVTPRDNARQRTGGGGLEPERGASIAPLANQSSKKRRRPPPESDGRRAETG